jgi:hypothetical protein
MTERKPTSSSGSAMISSLLRFTVLILVAVGLTSCSSIGEDKPADQIEVRDTPPPAFNPDSTGSSENTGDNDKNQGGGLSSDTTGQGVSTTEKALIDESVKKFAVTADFVIGAAVLISEQRGHDRVEVEDLRDAITGTEIVEDPSIWQVVEITYGFGLAAPVYGLGVCGVPIDPSWDRRPGAATIVTVMQCTGKTDTPALP